MVSYRALIKFVWQFMRTQKWIFILILVIDCLNWPVESVLWPYILHVAVDVFTRFEGDRTEAWAALKGPMISGVALVLYIETAARTLGFLMAKAIPKLQADIRMAMFDQIQRHSPRYFNERFAGTLANKMTDMTAQVEIILQRLFWPIIPALAGCLLGVGFLWFVNPIFAGIFLAFIIVHMGACIVFTRPADAYEHLHGEARSTLLGKIVDSFTNNFAVNLFYRFVHEKNIALSYQKVEQETNETSRLYVVKMMWFLSLFYFVFVCLGIFGSLIYLWLHNHITTGQVVQVFTMMLSLSTILWAVGLELPILFQSFGILKQAYALMLDPQDIADQPGAEELNVSSGEILFDNVSFHYGKRKLFENKHVHIRGGEKVGLVGFTGAGKSTFINLILRFFPLHDGRILIDGQDISQAVLESLRQQIALIPQDPVLFHRSLRENISYGKPEATEAEIIRAAKLAHCDEFIHNIPDGYEAKVGERERSFREEKSRGLRSRGRF